MKPILFVSIFLIIFSCNHRSNILQNKTESFSSPDIQIAEVNRLESNKLHVNARERKKDFSDELLARLDSISKIDSIKNQSELMKVTDFWEVFKKQEFNYPFAKNQEADTCLLRKWFAINFTLFKLTAEPKYADELWEIVFELSRENCLDENLLKQFVFTKLDDQLYINFFMESTAHYEHTTGGTIRISQETNFPDDGHVNIRFETSDKRFVELFIFIPSWAGKATVTVGGVKYKAVPGEYCRVAKMWKSGSVADVFIENTEVPVL